MVGAGKREGSNGVQNQVKIPPLDSNSGRFSGNICMVDGRRARDAAIGGDSAQAEASGLTTLAAVLYQVCIRSGAVVRARSLHVSLRATEHQVRHALKQLLKETANNEKRLSALEWEARFGDSVAQNFESFFSELGSVRQVLEDQERRPLQETVRVLKAALRTSKLRFVGVVGDGMRVRMTLSVSGNDIRGVYQYDSVRRPLRVRGTRDANGLATLREYSPSGDMTGLFQGNLAGLDRFDGTWSKPDGSRRLAFRLERGGGPPPADPAEPAVVKDYLSLDYALYIRGHPGGAPSAAADASFHASAAERLKEEGIRHYQLKMDETAVSKYQEALDHYATGEIYFHYANSLSNIPKLEGSMKAFKIADALGYQKKDVLYYNMACSYSRSYDAAQGFRFLEMSVRNGYRNFNQMERDGDLSHLRSQHTWGLWIQDMRRVSRW